MKKIVTIIGARPQFIKAATVSRMLKRYPTINEILVHTGQHYDTNMSNIFFDELEIPEVNYQLGIGSGTQGKQTGEMLSAIEKVLLQEKPQTVLVYGDTNSTLAGALAAVKCHIPVVHVEAGLRSYNRNMPEEINRLVADQLSDILFTPTEQASHNLKKEGFHSDRIIHIGDVMYDAALFYSDKAKNVSHILKELKIEPKKYILATIHRAENTNDKKTLMTIFNALNKIAKTHTIIMPLHPRTKKLMEQYDSIGLIKTSIQIIQPVGFLDMIMLEKNASLIVTDSGGVQKEAFFYKVPCVTLRSETEWIETVALGWNKIVNPLENDEMDDHIIQSINTFGEDNHYPYGKGDASLRIAEYLMQGDRLCEFG